MHKLTSHIVLGDRIKVLLNIVVARIKTLFEVDIDILICWRTSKSRHIYTRNFLSVEQINTFISGETICMSVGFVGDPLARQICERHMLRYRAIYLTRRTTQPSSGFI